MSQSDYHSRTDILKELGAKLKHVPITEELASYINNLLLIHEPAPYKEYRERLMTVEHSNMQISLSEARFLESLVKLTQATRVLEIGTFRGFSAAYLARSLPVGGKVITCEKDERSLASIQSGWKDLGVDHMIELRVGLAVDTLKGLKSEHSVFDLIFIDADKGTYEEYLTHSMDLVRKGGVILVDNVLWAGLVAYDDPGDNIGRHLQKFNQHVFERYGASACLIPAWDGVTLIVK